MSIERIYLEGDEFSWLIHQTIEHRFHVDAKFGPGWVGLEYDTENPMPKDVELLLKKRGVLNENMDGAGI